MHYLCIDVRIIAELLFVGFLASRRFGTTSTRRHAAMHREAFRIVRLTRIVKTVRLMRIFRFAALDFMGFCGDILGI